MRWDWVHWGARARVSPYLGRLRRRRLFSVVVVFYAFLDRSGHASKAHDILDMFRVDLHRRVALAETAS